MYLELTMFICGAVVMTLEIIGTRILSPYLGSTLDVWTSIIGINLLSLSLGYLWGGKLADKKANHQTLSLLVFLSSFFTILTFITRKYYLTQISNIGDIRIQSLIASLIMFFPVNFLLGSVSPYIVRLKLKKIDHSGTVVGKLYAVSTLGSIVGTFIAGFVLISYLSINQIIYLCSIILLINSLVLGFIYKTNIFIMIIIFPIFFGASLLVKNEKEKGEVLNIETTYSNLIVLDKLDKQNTDTIIPIRYLINNLSMNHSAVNLNNPEDLVFIYTKYFRLAEHFKHRLEDVLLIGAGAYSYPKYFLKNFPDGKIDTVEIDPKMTEIAKKYFFLRDDPRLTIYHQDGRVYLNKNKKKYDAIFMDAYNTITPPYYLTTKETVEEIFDSLQDKGVILTNIITSLDGPSSEFLKAEYKTYISVFPQVYVFNTSSMDYSSKLRRNIILVGIKDNSKVSFQNNDESLQKYLNNRITLNMDQDVPILTDNFAPVENMFVR